TSYCADFKTDVSSATGTGTALTEAQDAIRTSNVRESATSYNDAYALRLVDNGANVVSVSRKYHTTDLPSLSAISVGGCPGLALTIQYNSVASDSSDPGNSYEPVSGLPGDMAQVETGITNSIYEEDTTVFTNVGTDRRTFNSNFGAPKQYLVDSNGDCPVRQQGSVGGGSLTIDLNALAAGDGSVGSYSGMLAAGNLWVRFVIRIDVAGDGSNLRSANIAFQPTALDAGTIEAEMIAAINAAEVSQYPTSGPMLKVATAVNAGAQVLTITSDYKFELETGMNDDGASSEVITQSSSPGFVIEAVSTGASTPGDEFDFEKQLNAPVAPATVGTSKGYCFKLLNGPNGVSGVAGVTAASVAETTTAAKANEAIADVDSCPGTAAAVNYCSISDFAALITGQTVNGQTGSCVRRVYTDLCTEKVDSTYGGNSAHDHQLPGSDVASNKASYTKPLRISLPAGDYCDGYDATSIGTCTLQRKLQNEFVFEMSCEQLAAQMSATGNPTDVVGVRKLTINWDIGTPHSEDTLAEKDPNIKADFHCAEGSTTGLCGIGIPAEHPCHGLVNKVCANPYYVAEAAEPVYTTYDNGQGSVSCAPSDGALLTAWETAIGKTGTYRSSLTVNTELYDITCHDLRKEIEIDAKPKILELCDHIQADLDKARIDYATSYLLHDVQALKKVRQTNYKKHVTAYRTAIDSTCDSSFGLNDVTSLSTADIEGLKEDADSSSSKTLVAALEAAATTPEDVAINIQRQKIDQRVGELSESLNLLKEAYTAAAVPGVEVTAHVVKFNELAKVVYKTLANAFLEDIDADNTVPEPFNTRVGKEAACPHLGNQLLAFTNSYNTDGVLVTSPNLRRGSAATIDGTGSSDGLAISLNDGTSKIITNLVSILEYLVATSTYASESQSTDQRVDHLKEGLETLVAETVEYCIWESEDRFDRCETCAARKQLFNDKDIYQRVYTRLNTLSTYKTQRATLVAASCEAPITDVNAAGYPGGAGNAARVAACSIPAQSVLSSLAGIDGTASYIKGYPGTGFDDPATDAVETDQAHHRYQTQESTHNGVTYDKTAFQNDLAACEANIVQLDARGCPSTTLNSDGEAIGINDQLKLSSTHELALNQKAKAVVAGESLSTFESRRSHCLDALDVVIEDTSAAYDCAVSDPSNSACVDGSITHFVKQCLKTDGSAYVPHATPHSGAHDITRDLAGPGIYQAIKAYTDAEDAYDAAVTARSTREGQLNIDPSELKNLNDDVHSAETYRDVILAHIGDLATELKAFKNRHATVMTKCEDLVEAKVRAKVSHALELKKYDFEVEDLDAKKQAVNSKTYDGAKTALDEYCAEVAAVKDAVTIASLADVNKVVRAGSRCTAYNHITDSACCPPLAAGDILGGAADQVARSADCIAADQAIVASKLCVLDSGTSLYNGYSTKDLCLDAISTGSGVDGECVKTLPDGSSCSQADECTNGVCRDTVYNVGVSNDGGLTTTYDDSVVKECAAEAYVLSGGACTSSSDCRPFSSYRTANPPSGRTQHGNSGRWTQVCNAVGVCSDYNLGNEDDECAMEISGDGHVGSTCGAGLVCDLWLGDDGAEGGNDDSDRRTNGYETSTAHVGTNGKDVCIVNPTCSDGLQNADEDGVDCGGSCTHTSVCVAESDNGGSSQSGLAAAGAACTFHSDCANGAACEQQYHLALADGTSCSAVDSATGCQSRAIAGDKRCASALCPSDKPSPNSLYGTTVQCASSGSSSDPGESTNQLHQFTVNGITFTYYVSTDTTGTTVAHTSGRRLLSFRNKLNDINTHGFNFIHPVLEHATQEPHRLQSVKQRHVEKLARRYQQRLSHGEGSIDHTDVANSVNHWAEIDSHADADDSSYSSDLSVCRVPRGVESGSDQDELADIIECVGESDCCQAFQEVCDLTCQGATFSPLGALISKGQCSGVNPGNSAYNVQDLPEVDTLGVCKDDTANDGSFANDLEYSDTVAKKYGYKVSDKLHLNSIHHQSRVRGRHLRQWRQQQKRLSHSGSVAPSPSPSPSHASSHHTAAADPAPTFGVYQTSTQVGVSDPSNNNSPLFPAQHDSQRDCLHDGKKWCKFNKAGTSSGRGAYDYGTVPGFCSDDCSDCKIGDITCPTTTDCLMQGAQDYVASVQADPNCVPKWNNVYNSQSLCESAEDSGIACIRTHTCVMTAEQQATIGTPVDPTKCTAERDSVTNEIIKYTITPGQGDNGGNTRLVDANCDLSTGQDLSAVGTDGVCTVPAGQATCQQQGNCGNGVSCANNGECLTDNCVSNVCAQVAGDYCDYTNSDGTLQSLNDGNGVSIDEMTVAEIKAQFIDGTTESSVAIDTTAENNMINEEKTCQCSGLIAAAKSQGNDQDIIDEMESRIQELKNLLDDGHYADICTDGEKQFCDDINTIHGSVSYSECKSVGATFASECIQCLSAYDSAECTAAVTVNAHALSGSQGASYSCKSALSSGFNINDAAGALALYAQAAFLSQGSHDVGTTGCQVYEIDESLEGAAIKQIHQAKERLRLYLTNTASGAQEIANLEGAEATALTARDNARTAALEYASAAFLDYYKNTAINPRSNAYTAYVDVVQNGDINNDVTGQDDEYVDELHKIFAACQEAVEQKEAMGVASAAALNAKQAAADAFVKNAANAALDVADCKAKSTAEYNAKVALDLKRKAIVDLETELTGEGYVPVADIVKEHRHYSCCSSQLSNLLDLERCNSNSDCEPYGSPTDGHCVAGFCVLNPCICDAVSYTAGDSDNDGNFDAGFPIADADCGVSDFTPFCGNGVCDISVHGSSSTASQETFDSCPGDCKCGDGVCDHTYEGQYTGGESCHNCQGDCPNTNAGTVDNACPTDPHDDGECACYPSSESVLNCEDETNAPKDCTCERLCSGYSTASGHSLYAQPAPLSGATFSKQCERYDATGTACPSTASEDTATNGNRGSFCSEVNTHYTQSDGSVLVDSSLSGLDAQHGVCKQIAINFITTCSKAPVTVNGVTSMEFPDGQTAVAGLVAKAANTGLLSNCASLMAISGLSTQAAIDSLKRWTNPPVPCDDDNVDVSLRTKIDSECIDWSMTPGCPASCSCPAPVQPVIDSTDAVAKGSQIDAEVAENLCDDVCRCPAVGTVGEVGYAASYIVSGATYNSATQKVSSTVATGCLTTDSNPDEDCTLIVSTAYATQNDYEAAVGQCVLGNIARVHSFDCEHSDNGGTQEVQTGCTPVTYAHKTIAHDGSADECYGLNGYSSSDVSATAKGCRDTDGALTGAACYYGDGTACERGDAIAKASTVVEPVVTTAGSGHGSGAGTYTGGNRQCDEGETVSNCAVDCHCGDGVCGSFLDHTGATVQEDSSICPEDCSFHCYNGVSGGCYEFQRRNYPVGNWDSDKDASFTDTLAGFEAYCSSWPENAAFLAADSANTYAEIGGAGACPATGRRRRLLSVASLKEWAQKNLASAATTVTSKVSGMFRRKLLSIKPNDRAGDVPWLQAGDTSFDTDYANCLGSQSNTLANAITKAVKRSLGSSGFNTGAITLSTDAKIDSAISVGYLVSSAATESAIDLLAKQGLKAIQAELDKKHSEEGSCSAAQIAVVHKFSQSWVPTKKCFPLKFVQSIHDGSAVVSMGYGDVSVLCSGLAQLSLSEHTNPSPSTVSSSFDAYKKGRVQDSFLSLTREFTYLGYDKANIIDECSSEAANLCSADAASSRTHGTTGLSNSCEASDGSVYDNTANAGSAVLTFPGKVACVREFKNNLADIARHIDSSFQSTHMPYVGTSTEIDDYTMTHTYPTSHVSGTKSYDSEEHSAFAHAHLDNFAPETRNHKTKFENQRALVGDAEDENVSTDGQGKTSGSIQACWESYENSVGYATENAWITASGALSQAIVAVEKESIAIISAHANAKAECKEKCEIETVRDDWAHLVGACQGAAGNSGNGPSRCECRRASEATTAEDLANPDLVHCGCVVGANGGGIGDQLENLLGDGSEDCQLNPSDFITASDGVSQIGGVSGTTSPLVTHQDGEYALVYAGEQPTAAVQAALNAIITKSQTDINTYVNSLVTNLNANLASGGLLNQQGAGSLTAVCHRIHNAEESSAREALDLSNVASMDGFFANYLEQTQVGSLSDSSASRRLASEPCELCD
ncbi:MAG: hypothetical protein CMJ55_01875, partial [Planctomycetaceae bacterium]|nr:hypothetical protein [Planctomycetaceae bacterium]